MSYRSQLLIDRSGMLVAETLAFSFGLFQSIQQPALS